MILTEDIGAFIFYSVFVMIAIIMVIAVILGIYGLIQTHEEVFLKQTLLFIVGVVCFGIVYKTAWQEGELFGAITGALVMLGFTVMCAVIESSHLVSKKKKKIVVLEKGLKKATSKAYRKYEERVKE